MLKFLLGGVIGTLFGAAAILVFVVLGGTNAITGLAPRLVPGQAVIRVSVEGAYLSQQMNAALAGQQQLQVSNAQLTLRAPNDAIVAADAVVEVAGVKVRARPTVGVQFAVEDGRVKTRLGQINVGGIGVPTELVRPQLAEMERILEAQINRAISGGLTGTGLRISSISVVGSALVVDLAQ